MKDNTQVDYYKKQTTCDCCNKVEYKKIDLRDIEPGLYIRITKEHGLWKLSLRNGNTTNKFWDNNDEWIAWATDITSVVNTIYKYKGLAGKDSVVDISAPNNTRMLIHSEAHNSEQLYNNTRKMLRG